VSELNTVMSSAAFDTARAVIRDTDELTLAHMMEVTRIPAPLHGEAERGRWLAARLGDAGLETATDSSGNIIAVTPSVEPERRRIVVAAHLDTVFSVDTPLDVRRDGHRLTGPGISDNARGLAGVLTLARALAAAGWPTRLPIAFVGTVGEEGAGDLRGAKHYMAEHAGRTAAFIALDGAGARRVINAGVGSRRLRVTYTGPGGHSWSDWGTPNAIHAAGRAIASLLRLDLAAEPRTTLSVGRIGGGTSINAIAGAAWLELDLRSEARAPLLELEARVRAALGQAAAKEGGATRAIGCEVAVFGDRPAGTTPASQPLVRMAEDATRAVGLTPQLASSSTDANVAMAAGIPAIAIGAGGDAGGTHTTGEWYDNTDGPAGLERALLVLLAAAGLP
jgi:tripeptide aminopeptidase